MSIITLRSSAPTNYAAVLAENLDADFERRWTAWIARGVAHDTVMSQRLIALGIVVAAVALAGAIAYSLISM